jgi:hypothetical protein
MKEIEMGKFNKHQSDRDRFGRCEICLEYIPIEYYFGEGDTVVCYECGTEYVLTSKYPIKLSMSEGRYDEDDYFGGMIFED